MRREKKTEAVKVWMSEELKYELKVLAASMGFESLSPFICKILIEYVYGHQHSNRRDLLAGTVRDE